MEPCLGTTLYMQKIGRKEYFWSYEKSCLVKRHQYFNYPCMALNIFPMNDPPTYTVRLVNAIRHIMT